VVEKRKSAYNGLQPGMTGSNTHIDRAPIIMAVIPVTFRLDTRKPVVAPTSRRSVRSASPIFRFIGSGE
jgi:hypothetical protein